MARCHDPRRHEPDRPHLRPQPVPPTPRGVRRCQTRKATLGTIWFWKQDIGGIAIVPLGTVGWIAGLSKAHLRASCVGVHRSTCLRREMASSVTVHEMRSRGPGGRNSADFCHYGSRGVRFRYYRLKMKILVAWSHRTGTRLWVDGQSWLW